MDFLDPRKRRHHQIRLMIGYFLTAIAIVLTATILVYWAYGYSLDTKTGNVVENGLLFVDSKPGGASIYLNGKSQNATTASRLNLNAGNYDLSLKKDGYRDWRRQLVLSEHSVVRVIYPLLIPKEIKSQTIKGYSSSPTLMTQSIDQRWLLVLVPTSDPKAPIFEMYETAKPTQPPQLLNFPGTLLTNTDKPGSALSAVEWSVDNNHLLLRHNWNGGVEFIIFNRANPAVSVNLNRLFQINPSDAALFNRRADQVYLHNQDGSLVLANLTNTTSQTLLKQVTSYKSLESGPLLFLTTEGAPAGQMSAKILENAKQFSLASLPLGNRYIAEAAQFQSHWYYIVGSDKSSRLAIYKDPLNGLKDPALGKAEPLVALINSAAQSVQFSANFRFIGGQNGQKLSVYDIENKTRYQFSLTFAPAEPLKWMDGHRWIARVDGSILIMDFDSQNQYKLSPTASGEAYFDRDFSRMFNLRTAADGNSTVLQLTDLRIGSDLPH